MKTLWMKTISLLLCVATIGQAQNREQVPGDNFSLEGALELFKKSSSPEEFERLLNLPESEVNNLDLNGDGDVDYIRVIDRNDRNIHTFTLQAVISRNEFQDVAVISLEKLADGKAILQITGDADIYGIETIIEPTDEVRINAGTTTARSYANVWTWPSVQYVYSPYYSPWVSPWYWDYWPYWWHSWRPVTYVVYYPRWERYRPYYRVCDAPRIRYAYTIYVPHRSASVVVYNRHRNQISNYRNTHTVYGETRGRDRDNSQHRYQRDDAPRRVEERNTSRTEWKPRETDRSTRTSEQPENWRNNRSTQNRTRTDWNSHRQQSSSQWERPGRNTQQNNSGSRTQSYNPPSRQSEIRPPARSSQPTLTPERRSSEGSSSQRSGTGSQSSGSSGGQRRGRD